MINSREHFRTKWSEVVTPDGIISLVLVYGFLQELPHLIKAGYYPESTLDEFKQDFNNLNVQWKRDKVLNELGI